MDMLRKTFQIEVKKEDVNDEASTLLAAVSSERRDRDGEIIRISENSVDLEGYRKNPVLLWNHRSDDPIGRAQWIKAHEKKLLAKFEFHKKTQRSKEIFELYKSGFLNSFSIGFRPTVPRNDAKVFRKIELYEISAVSVPSNIDAIVQNGYSEKISDSILRKDLSLEAISSPQFLLDADMLAKALKEAMNPDAIKEKIDEGIEKSLSNMRNKFITIEKEDRMIEVDVAEVKKIINTQLEAALKGVDIEKILAEKTKENLRVQMGRLTGKVF